MSSRSAVFVDTSIQISRFLKSDDLKKKIRSRLATFDLVVTGLVVRNEFRRRVLTEAQYLLRLLDRYNSAKRVQQHINDELGGWQNQRKRNICLDLLATFYPESSDRDHTDRLKSILRSLLVGGLEEFDDCVDSVISDSGCSCGSESVKEIEPYRKYELGRNSCKEFKDQCGIKQFLFSKRKALESLEVLLSTIPQAEKSGEITAIETAIGKIASGGEDITDLELCKKVGDLLIALESSHIPNFFTQNIRESQHLCRALNQCLYFRDNHPDNEDDIRDWKIS